MAERQPRTTGSMQSYASAIQGSGSGRPGLVLLYAPTFAGLAPAYLFARQELVIGRDDTCDICLPEAAVSRRHARIFKEDDRYVLADLGSRNGTLVDGQPIQKIVLEDLQEVRIGDAIFKFVASAAELYLQYRIDGASTDSSEPSLAGIVGNYQIKTLLRSLHRIARSEISVVISGESGTGKELFARELHAASGRRGPLQAVNCAAIPATLLESELFGYKRGAFSGADRDRVGIVKAADGGTLFLDEIGDMPLEAQSKLLRVLQSREVIPLGATAPERVDVRIVCATHRNLLNLQRDGRFRGDLFARLNEYTVSIPPLRDRKEDIYGLLMKLLERHGSGRTLRPSFAFMTGLMHYDWPFNVRELEAAIKRAVVLAESDELDIQHLPEVIRETMEDYGRMPFAAAAQLTGSEPASVTLPPQSTGRQEGPARAEATPRSSKSVTPSEEVLRAAIARHQGNIAAVGREFGKERMQVHRWIKRYNIDLDIYR